MNTIHPADALFIAAAHLDALRTSARAQEAADAAARNVSCRANRRITAARRRIPRMGNLRQNTSDRPLEAFCPHI